MIGVPVPLKHLDGLDSLLSIVQMPAGIPVATVVDRRRPQRRPAGRPHPRRRPTPQLRARVADFQTALAETARSKNESLRDRLG